MNFSLDASQFIIKPQTRRTQKKTFSAEQKWKILECNFNSFRAWHSWGVRWQMASHAIPWWHLHRRWIFKIFLLSLDLGFTAKGIVIKAISRGIYDEKSSIFIFLPRVCINTKIAFFLCVSINLIAQSQINLLRCCVFYCHYFFSLVYSSWRVLKWKKI